MTAVRLTVLQLLEYGAAVDAVDAQKGRTALHRAIKGSVMMYPMDAKIVTLLLESGANPFCADKKGQSVSSICQSVSPVCQSVSLICQPVSPICHLLFICCSFWIHYHWHLPQGVRTPSQSPSMQTSRFLLPTSLGSSFSQKQLHEHVHHVRPLMCSHFGLCLQDSTACLLACSDPEVPCRLHRHRLCIPQAHVNECARPQQL